MDAHQEQQIAQGLRAGDVASWHALYDTHVETVWRMVARRIGPATSETADVVQEVFLEAARGVSTYDARQGTLGAWLRGIVRRQVANYFRRRQRFDRPTREDDADRRNVLTIIRYLDGRHPAPGDVIETSETARRVRATLASLPEDYQYILTGKYLDEMSVEQLADELRLSQEAVRSRLARARRAFRKLLNAGMGEDVTSVNG